MIYLDIVDHNELFNTLKTPPIIVNEFNIDNIEDKERLNSMIYTSYSEDSLEIVPSCDCGILRGQRNVGLYHTNKTDPDGEEGCNTMCVSIVERPLESILWIGPPKGVSTLINPDCWIIMNRHLSSNDVSMLEWMTKPRYQPKNPHDPNIEKLKALYEEHEGVRGLNFFHENFDDIFEMLIDNRLIQASNAQNRDHFIQFIRMNREKLFSSYIPIPSKLLFITESTATGRYGDSSMTVAMNAIRTISMIENSLTPLDVKARERLAIEAIEQLAEYYQDFFKEKLGKKEGWFRKHVFGSRLHFTFRAVISSISDVHHYTELHLPWSMSVLFFKIHLTSKLMKRGFTPNECVRYLYEHTLKYDYLLDELFQELIAESIGLPEVPGQPGIPVILQRNPTLTRLSAQRLRVTHIKGTHGQPHEVDIKTVGLSTLVLAGMNADFDGKSALPSLNFFNCWKLLRALLPLSQRKHVITV